MNLVQIRWVWRELGLQAALQTTNGRVLEGMVLIARWDLSADHLSLAWVEHFSDRVPLMQILSLDIVLIACKPLFR